MIKIILLFLVYFTSVCNMHTQNINKRSVTTEDYHQWGLLESREISKYGNWHSFSVSYEQGSDTLFVQSTHNSKKFIFPNADKGIFLDEKWYSSINDRKELSLLELESGKIQIEKNAEQYLFTTDNKYIIILSKQKNNSKTLIIKSLDNSESYEIEHIEDFAYHEITNQLIYSSTLSNSCTVSIFKLGNQKVKSNIMNSETHKFGTFVWQKNAGSVLFIKSKAINDDDDQKAESPEIVYYKTDTKNIHILETRNIAEFDEKYTITNRNKTDLVLSKDGKKVFFKFISKENKNDRSKQNPIELWNSKDKYLQTMSRESDGSIKTAKVAVWWPEKKDYKILTDTVYSKIMLTNDSNVAVVWNPVANEPQSNLHPARDYKTIHLENGQENHFLKNFYYSVNTILLSPSGKFITYFQNHHWWIYDIQKNSHTNITSNTNESFSVEHLKYGADPLPYGLLGWKPNDSSILLYDKYDIWEISMANFKAVKLTNGRKNATVYRMLPTSKHHQQIGNYDGLVAGIINLNQPILLQSKSDDKNGLCRYTKNKIVPLVLTTENISETKMSSNGLVIYKRENFEIPPSLFIQDYKTNRISKLYQSNNHYRFFNWGSSKIIKYRNITGEILNAALFYPANYDSDKYYPMVVHVYDKQSKKAYEYTNPSLYSEDGFNTSHYTNNGYFVLMPDIEYEYGNVGNSAVDCVVAATKEAIAVANVDSKRIGLIGHSFGGYETDYIITQTDTFAAAVAGSAFTNLISNYLSISWNSSIPNFYHYEYGQLRMGGSLFENFLSYLTNSPVFYADRVSTPLLSWSGKEDKQIHYSQTIEFYLALRRLGKNNTMLLYPNQGHALTDRNYQKHLSENIMNWFNHYLKKSDKIN